MIKKLLFILLFLSGIILPAQTRMNDKTKIHYSRAWKIIGLSLIASGIYAGRNNAPQRYDVPLIGFGAIITIEGIRLRKTAHK